MKRYLLLCLSFIALASCQKQELPSGETVLDPVFYVLKFANESDRLFVAGNTAEITVCCTNDDGFPINVQEDLNCTVYVPSNSSELKTAFNEKWASSAVVAPASYYSIGTATIKAGSSKAVAKLSVDVNKIKSANSYYPYLLPLRIKTDNPSVKSQDLMFVVLPTYTKNSSGRVIAHFSSSDAYLEMYFTDQSNKKAMIFCPGGGYSELSNPLPTDYAGNEIAVGVLWYRLPKNALLGRHDLTIQDAEDALDILEANAQAWGGYTQIGTAGRSAGGHLAAVAAQYFRNKVNFQILLYAVINMDISKTHEGSVYQFLGDYYTPKDVDDYTMFNHVGADSPRAFLTWCKDDHTVPQEFNCAPMAAALQAAGVSTTTSIFETGGHATGPDYPGCVLDWLKTF